MPINWDLIRDLQKETENTGWTAFNKNLQEAGAVLGNYAMQERQRKRDMEDAMQTLTMKAQVEQLARQQDPMYQVTMGMLNKWLEQESRRRGAIDTTGQVIGEQPPEIVEPRDVIQEDEYELEQSFNIGEGGKATMSFKPRLTREAELRRKGEEAEIAVGRERLKKRKESEVNFEIARNKLKTTAGAFKAMIAQEGAGRIGGFKRIFTGATGENPYVKAFEGQLVEAAASLAKLAAPSARVGQEIIAQFRKTLPTKFSTQEEFVNQIRFSLHNAFSTTLANSGEEYTQDIRDKVDNMVEDIINTPALEFEDINKFGGFKQQPKRTEQGKSYKYLWE